MYNVFIDILHGEIAGHDDLVFVGHIDKDVPNFCHNDRCWRVTDSVKIFNSKKRSRDLFISNRPSDLCTLGLVLNKDPESAVPMAPSSVWMSPGFKVFHTGH